MSDRVFRVVAVATIGAYWSIGFAIALHTGVLGVVVCWAIDRALASITRDAEKLLGGPLL